MIAATDRLTVVLTGASSGIGAAATKVLAADGHRLFVCARRASRLEALRASSPRVEGRVCDVSDAADVDRFAAWVREHTPHVDAVINCAGGFGAIGRVWETDAAEWAATIQTNLVGTYLISRAFVPLLRGAVRPRIINFSGGGAFGPFPHYSAYAVSKAGVVRLTETLAVELRPLNVMVNAVAPGFVATEIHDATLRAGERAGTDHFTRTRQWLNEPPVPIDVPVACVQFLLSPQSDGLTGKTISASFDPWSTPQFQDEIPGLNESELYTQRRINLEHLPDGELKQRLRAANAARLASLGAAQSASKDQ